jgi:putative phosphoribosyl transferase
MFRDREEAGQRLASKLAELLRPPCVVAAIPHGGLCVAMPVTEVLHAPLTVAFVRRLASPSYPEFAIGAVDEDGRTIFDEEAVDAVGAGAAEIAAATGRVLGDLHRQKELFHAPPLAALLPDSAVVLVDDGLATGLTMRAALAFVRRHGAKQVVVAAPCASLEAARRLGRDADRLVSLRIEDGFFAVSDYYEDFPTVSDEEVVAILERARPIGEGRPGG